MLLITGFELTQLNTDPGKVFSVAPASAGRGGRHPARRQHPLGQRQAFHDSRPGRQGRGGSARRAACTRPASTPTASRSPIRSRRDATPRGRTAWSGRDPAAARHGPVSGRLGGRISLHAPCGGIVQGIWSLVSGQVPGGLLGPQGLTGPIGIADTARQAVTAGPAHVRPPGRAALGGARIHQPPSAARSRRRPDRGRRDRGSAQASV